MNEVSVSTEGLPEPAWIEEARGFALRALGRLGKEGWDLSILLCGAARFIVGLVDAALTGSALWPEVGAFDVLLAHLLPCTCSPR